MKKIISVLSILVVISACNNKNKEEVKIDKKEVHANELTDVVIDQNLKDSIQMEDVKNTSNTDYKEISTETYKGDNKEIMVTYLGNDMGNMKVKIIFDGKTFDLPQTEAWAKGAIYSNGETTFTNKGQVNKAELKLGDKVYRFEITK